MTTSTSNQIQSLLKGINTTSQALQELIETDRTEQAATKGELDATKTELVVVQTELAVTKAKLGESETMRNNVEAENKTLALQVQKLEKRRDAVPPIDEQIQRMTEALTIALEARDALVELVQAERDEHAFDQEKACRGRALARRWRWEQPWQPRNDAICTSACCSS
jgi:type IV secretory pathway VirJ component